MGTFTAAWEDDENNRILELAVRYRMDGGQLHIESVTPASVLFRHEHTKTVIRKIGVHTEKGQRILRKQFVRNQGLDWLEQELSANQQQVLATA